MKSNSEEEQSTMPIFERKPTVVWYLITLVLQIYENSQTHNFFQMLKRSEMKRERKYRFGFGESINKWMGFKHVKQLTGYKVWKKKQSLEKL